MALPSVDSISRIENIFSPDLIKKIIHPIKKYILTAEASS